MRYTHGSSPEMGRTSTFVMQGAPPEYEPLHFQWIMYHGTTTNIRMTYSGFLISPEWRSVVSWIYVSWLKTLGWLAHDYSIHGSARHVILSGKTRPGVWTKVRLFSTNNSILFIPDQQQQLGNLRKLIWPTKVFLKRIHWNLHLIDEAIKHYLP